MTKNDDRHISKTYDLSGTQLTALPDNLRVGGDLDLRGTAITALPMNLSPRKTGIIARLKKLF